MMLGGWGVWWLARPGHMLSPLAQRATARPLLKYTFANLRAGKFAPDRIVYDGLYGKQDPRFASWTFHYYSGGKRVSGLANLPVGVSTESGRINVPAILMLHGSVDDGADYFPGFGTQPVAAFLAANGFATFAPDFLDYGSSDKGGPDPFEDRFETYTTNMTILETLSKTAGRVGIWGHSNGGQIGLSILEISGGSYPTVLWAPVSKMFPYNILYYTDVYADGGKWLRAALARFEELYDVQNYSTPNYLSWINAPILLQQGGADPWVPQKWSDEVYRVLKEKGKRIEYKVYPGADHNMQPRWAAAAADALAFFKSEL